MSINILVKKLESAASLQLPAYQSQSSAGFDLMAAVADNTSITLNPGERALVPTGLTMEIPLGFEGQIRPRSGLALRHGITVLNTPGTIDSDYRGEIGVILVNLGAEPFQITRGMRIAQMVVAPAIQVRLVETDTLADTERGEGGFGSTGVSGSTGEGNR